jgi:hypothetical protein
MNKNESIASRIIKGILLILAGLILLVGINWIGKVTSPDTPQTSKNITLLLSSVGTILILYAVGHFLLPSGYVSMNLPDNSGPKHYLQGLAYGSGMILTYLTLAVVFGGLSYQGLGKMAVLNIILYFLGFILQGFKEELLIRGLIQDLIAKKSRLLSIILPSVLFALLHLGNDNFSYMAMINTALIGLIFALLTDLSGSLWLASAAHSIWNFLLGPFFGLYVSGIPMPESVFAFSHVAGKELISGGLYGPEAALLLTIILILFLVPLVRAYILKYKKQEVEQDLTLPPNDELN